MLQMLKFIRYGAPIEVVISNHEDGIHVHYLLPEDMPRIVVIDRYPFIYINFSYVFIHMHIYLKPLR